VNSIEQEAADLGIEPPSQSTLMKYGISRMDWLTMLARQGWKCAICRRIRGRWNIDHEHIPGWSKLAPEERKIYVRGVLCWYCNKEIVPSNLTARDAKNMSTYLAKYEARRNKWLQRVR